MRRALIATSVLSLILGSLGCSHIAGRSDCYHHPDNAETGGVGGQPYATLGHPFGPPAVPEVLAAPIEKMPAPVEKAK